jgi:hypothetical protein
VLGVFLTPAGLWCLLRAQRAEAAPQVEALLKQMADLRIHNARLADTSSTLSQDRLHFEV